MILKISGRNHVVPQPWLRACFEPIILTRYMHRWCCQSTKIIAVL